MSPNQLSPHTIGEQDAYLEKDRVYIWSRKLAEALELPVSFDESSGKVWIGGYEFIPAKLDQGRSFIKVKDVLEPLGLQAEWNNDNQTLALYQNKKVVESTEVFHVTPEKVGEAFLKEGKGYIATTALSEALHLTMSLSPGGLAVVENTPLPIAVTLEDVNYLEGDGVAQALGMKLKTEPEKISFLKLVTRQEPIFAPFAKIPVDGVNAYLQDDHVHVWAKYLAELLGAIVSFDSQSHLLTFTLMPRQRIILPTKLEQGKAFVKVREIAEGFGFKVDFDSTANAVVISKPTGQSQTTVIEETAASFQGVQLGKAIFYHDVFYMEGKFLASTFNLTYVEQNGVGQISGDRVASLDILNDTYLDAENVLKNSGIAFQKDSQTGTIIVSQEKEVERRTLMATVKPKVIRDINGFFNLSRPIPGIITSNYGMRFHPLKHTYSLHAGIDFAGNSGDPIYALADGKVIYTDYNGAYGNTVILDHYNGYFSRYSHIKEEGFLISSGSYVIGGQPIAKIGTTGSSTGPHLHFGLYRANWRLETNAINPWELVDDVLS